MGPAWSPDGRWIAFYSSRGRRDAYHGLYVMRADGSGVHRLARGPGELPAWSPDGRFVVYAALHGLAIVRASGERVATLELAVPTGANFASWAPRR